MIAAILTLALTAHFPTSQTEAPPKPTPQSKALPDSGYGYSSYSEESCEACGFGYRVTTQTTSRSELRFDPMIARHAPACGIKFQAHERSAIRGFQRARFHGHKSPMIFKSKTKIRVTPDCCR